MKKTTFFLPILSIFFNLGVHSQQNPEDIASNQDEFEISFFESIKQKSIQNHDKALESLEKCLKLDPQNATVYFEIGKNHLELRQYKQAYDSFEKATTIDPKNRWFYHGMYDVCYQTQDFLKAIDLVLILIPFDAGYREDLASLYMRTQQLDKALTVINELNATVGKSEKRELYKAQILSNPQNQGAEIKNLLDLIAHNPQDEGNYNALMLLYTKAGQEREAQAIASKLETAIPTSDWAQVSLFKKYIVANDGKNAATSMNKVLASTKIDNKIKHRILNEFLIFAKIHPGFDNDLEQAIGFFKSETTVKIAKEIGKFFQSKQDWFKAIPFYEIELRNNPDDIESMILALECYMQCKKFELLVKKADTTTELFPLQPQPYLYAAIGNNQLKNFKKAKDSLLAGIDFVVDQPALEMGFYQQLATAYEGLLDFKNKDLSSQKASAIKQKFKL